MSEKVVPGAGAADTYEATEKRRSGDRSRGGSRVETCSGPSPPTGVDPVGAHTEPGRRRRRRSVGVGSGRPQAARSPGRQCRRRGRRGVRDHLLCVSVGNAGATHSSRRRGLEWGDLTQAPANTREPRPYPCRTKPCEAGVAGAGPATSGRSSRSKTWSAVSRPRPTGRRTPTGEGKPPDRACPTGRRRRPIQPKAEAPCCPEKDHLTRGGEPPSPSVGGDPRRPPRPTGSALLGQAQSAEARRSGYASMRDRSSVAAELEMNSLRGATSLPMSRSKTCSAASRSDRLILRSVR